jgi:hypothetical protein
MPGGYIMAQLTFSAEQFKKLLNPVESDTNHVRYVCYAKASALPQELAYWMSTNPREQKMTTFVAKEISNSLRENPDFHELNRGILLSAQSATYDNQTNTVSIVMEDSDIHGNIDGGHTLRAILDAQTQGIDLDKRYVFLEIFTGLDSPANLAAARNTSVQVDLRSIEELKNSFEVIKEVFRPLQFSQRIAYKMNEHYNDQEVEPIDVREIITVVNMFNQALYPVKGSDGRLSDTQPIECYTGKETSLRKYLKLGKIPREQVIKQMSPIINDIFKLWDYIECNFAELATKSGKRYGTRKYSKFDDNRIIGKSLYYQNPLKYIVPKGIMYPIVGAFRSLVTIDQNQYKWVESPMDVLEILGSQLVSIVLNEKTENPEVLGKNNNLWSNLFKEVYILGCGI